MIKKLLILLMSVSFACSAFAQEQEALRAEVNKTWTIDEARQEAFRNTPQWINTRNLSPIDPNLLENRMAIQAKKGQIGDRWITIFPQSGTYCISITSQDWSYYYDDSGKLKSVGYDNQNKQLSEALLNNPDASDAIILKKSFPIKILKYQYPSGILLSTSFKTDEINDYVFKPDGSLSAHWVINKCYNVDGSSCGTRKSFQD